MLPFFRKRLPVGATTNWGSRHPIAAYCSFIDPEGVKGWVGLNGWLTYSGRFTHINGHPWTTDRAQNRESSPIKERRSTAVLRNQPRAESWILPPEIPSQIMFAGIL